ncbi:MULTISPECIES: TIGR02300 family protein [unclassified Roseivivax]|uniref:TIGR02300 family protein n=1 Tax=Roseivivax sp. GX 12232 TaxID=2900547 RepID=UPI001E527A92|nr:TIGR02300 family protein [Roseivivax sp. GX 12232]MCE0505693.1 TIGR02300 family protein [Roseivivax sp. GX 12232]
MAKEEWGVKRVCPTTGKRFYDLNQDPVISPYTGEVVEVETGKRSMIAADSADGASRKSKSKKSEETESTEDDDVDVDLGDDDVLDDDEDDDNVSLDEIADVSENDDD